MGRIGHIEIAGQDGEKLEEFYANLLGWQIDRRDIGGHQYGDVKLEGASHSLGIRHEPDGKAEIVLYVAVEDLDASVAKALDLGATLRIPRIDAGEIYFALVQDPEGNPLGLTESKE